MKKEILNFGDCKIEQLEKLFGLRSLSAKHSPILQSWLNAPNEVSEREQNYLLILQEYLQENVEVWNEQELAMHFIGPMFALVGFNYHRQFNLFAERELVGQVDGIDLGGKPDGMIATGYWQPEKPYFCFQEYSPPSIPPESGGTEGGNGDPQAQALAAMLVAQALNEGQFPIYGCYVRGRSWYFMTLEGKNYAFSDGYVATKAEIFDILRILKVLKQMIIERVVSSQLTMDNKPMTTDKGRLTTNQ